MSIPGMPRRQPKLRIGKGFNSRITKAGKKAEDHFDALVRAHLESLGAVWRQSVLGWVVETKAGPLRIFPHGHWIACCFQDVDRAKLLGLFGLNGYSGKWNHHYDIGAAEADVENFKACLKTVLP